MFTCEIVESPQSGEFVMKARLLLLPLALAACVSACESARHEAAPTPASASVPTSTIILARYHWQLHDAVDGDNRRLDALFGKPEPLQLDFSADRISVRNACNNIHGNYALVEGHLVAAPLLHTMMACADQTLMQRESTNDALLQERPTLILSTTGDTPLLTLAADSGLSLTFTGKQTAEARYNGPGETVYLEVAPNTTPCDHPPLPDKTCLLVRERHYDAQGLHGSQPGPWQPLQQDVDGYVHQPGTRNVLRVKRYTLTQPPADAPPTAYVLDMIVESEIVKPSGPTDTPHQP
jgi:heat shock protein HslJ